MTEDVPPAEPVELVEGSLRETVCLTDMELASFWRTEDINLTPTQQKLLPEIRKWLARRRNNALADYLIGKPTEAISPAITKELTADVLARFRPRAHGVDAVSLIIKLIDRGNAEGMVSLCPPPIAVLIKRQSSPFREDRWPTLAIGPRLREVLAQSIRQPVTIKRSQHPPQRIAMIALGQTMVSAIVHGGLVSASVLEALLDKLADAEPAMQGLGGRLFVELSLGYQKQTSAEFRRWYPDALTAVLMMNLPAGTAKIAAGDEPRSAAAARGLIWSCIRAFIRTTPSLPNFPLTLTTLLDAIQLDLESRIPIYLAHYAARSFVSHSLKPSVYRRLHGWPADSQLDQHSSDASGDELGNPGSGLTTESELNADVEPRWLAGLRTAMKGDDRASIIQRIDELLTAPAPGFIRGDVGELFAGFARRLFATSNTNKVRMAVSSARGVALSVSVRLGGLVGCDISNFGAEEWIGLYEEAVSDAETPGVRRKLVRALRDFQYYMEQERGAEPISGAEVFAVANGLVPVDANVISEPEFLRIRERFTDGIADELPGLATRQDGSKLADVAWLILTISYRCGLRRMEVLKLELGDMLLLDRPELLVRPTESRRLKSKSSTRKLPLYALLKADEIERLRDWFRQRQVDEAQRPYSPFVFAIPGRGFVFVPQDTLFKLLHRVMRDVAGDSTLRFHHLRHSFASRTLLVLAASAGQCGERISPTLPGFKEALEQAGEFRQRLFGNCRMTRRDLWAVSSLLGHSGPDVSAEHYVHHLDILLAESLAHSSIAPEKAVVITASGAPPAQAYRDRQGEFLDRWVARLYEKRGGKPQSAPTPETPVPVAKSAPGTHNKDDAGDSLTRIWRLVFVAQTSNQSLDEIAERCGIEVGCLQTYVKCAEWIASLKPSNHGSRWRHRCIDWTPDRRDSERKRRIACPVKPHEQNDIALVARLAMAFRHTYGENRDLLRHVVGHYVREVHISFSGLIFKNPEHPDEAKKFVRCLKVLGCDKSEIEFISYDVTSKHSVQAKAWRTALKIHSSIPIRKSPPPNGRTDWACPWLGIQPVFDNGQGQREGNPAFRYVMVMAAIALGIGPQT